MLRHAAQGSGYATRLAVEARVTGKRRGVPCLLRVINKDEASFARRSRYGANLRLLREQHYQVDDVETSTTQTDHHRLSNFLILKSDLSHIKCLKEESEHLVVNDMKSVIMGDQGVKRRVTTVSSGMRSSATSQAGAPSTADSASDTNSSSIISDTSSVYSSASAILDSISSIFSMRSATSQAPAKPKLPSTPADPIQAEG